MERRELRQDRHMVSLLTDHVIFSPKYRGKILEGSGRECFAKIPKESKTDEFTVPRGPTYGLNCGVTVT